MSDILASIRKIMAQDPEPELPTPARGGLNGVSGLANNLSREPELRLPTRDPAPDGTGPAGAMSLDELLAETPRAIPSSPPATGPKAPPAGMGARLEAGPHPDLSKSASASTQVVAPAATAEPANGAAAPGAAPSAAIGAPPMPKLGDLGSVVPGKFGGDGPPQSMESGGESPTFGSAFVSPVPGEPMGAPVARAAMPEMPGADALRRLIAGVIPPSAHPNLAPTGKTPEPVAQSAPAPAPAAPTRFITRSSEPDKSDNALETALEPKLDAKAEAKPEAKVEPKALAPKPPVADKPDVPDPAPAPVPARPVAAAPVAVPPPKPMLPSSVPNRAAKLEPLTPPPSAAPTSQPSGQTAAKSMDETVVELLRPLLRDWLNTNMPRLIEPALKAELEVLRNETSKDKKN